MKKRDWAFEVKSEAANSDSYEFSLGLKDTETKKTFPVIPLCRSLEELQQEISRIKAELDGIQQQASEMMHSMAGNREDKEINAKEIWKKMEQLPTEEEMFNYFNSFSSRERQLIAEYILSNVNMFKGRGPVFSESYDTVSHTLGMNDE